MVTRRRAGLEYALLQTGPLSMAPSQMGLFARSTPEQATPNLQYHVQPLSLDAFGEPLHDFPGLTLSVCNLRPTSRGSVHIVSPDPVDAPVIDPNYLATEADRRVAADALIHARRLAGTAPLCDHVVSEHFPGAHLASPEELAAAAGRIGTSIFHVCAGTHLCAAAANSPPHPQPVGTCKMGRAEDPGAVVDAHLRVRGIDGLRVADASIMPAITSGNTNSPTLAIAEKASEMILAA